ncbi:hypothetical protein JXA32_15825 [Candidatus Sumerlaeota bacterium]|nr:hypothetical protein [Candidatus Sumerlaeota bacterium]
MEAYLLLAVMAVVQSKAISMFFIVLAFLAFAFVVGYFVMPSNMDLYRSGYKQEAQARREANDNVQWQTVEGVLLECNVVATGQRSLRKTDAPMRPILPQPRFEKEAMKYDAPDWKSGHCVQFTYSYSVDGEEYRGFKAEGAPDFQTQAEAEQIKSKIKPGKTITVYYDPEAHHYSKVNFYELF